MSEPAGRCVPSSAAAGLPDFALRLLRCPVCRAPLRAGGTAFVCAASRCSLRFDTVNAVPILVRPGSVYGLASGAEIGLSQRRKSRVHAFALRHLPTLERNISAPANRALLESLLFEQADTAVVLNIGGKHGAAMAAGLRSDARVRCIEADVALGPQTAVLCDPHDLPFEDASFDAVLADAVLEHLIDPERAVAEMYRVLRPGGLVYSDVPFMLPVHGGRYDFLRFSALAHRALFRHFDEVATGLSSGPGAALANAAQALLLSFCESRPSRFAVKTLCRLTLFWLKYADLVLSRRDGALDAALGTYFVGRKVPREQSDREILASYRGATPDLFELIR